MSGERVVDAGEFYSALAADYRGHFEAPHRRAYDRMAWDLCTGGLAPASTIIDVGCGVGRWAEPLVLAGHTVIGFDPSPAMVAEAARLDLGPAFSVCEGDADTVELVPGSADLVIAMGSIQYAPDPDASIARIARWLAPGGRLCVLADSLLGLVIELVRNGDAAQAAERAATARGRFTDRGATVEHHLYTADRLEAAFGAAGLADISVRGLLVDWNSRPRAEAQERLCADWVGALAAEAVLAELRPLADHGKQLLACGTR